MNPTLSSLMHRPVFSVGPDDTALEIEEELVARKLSWVPVVEPGGNVLGVISSADLLRCHADGKQPSKVRAWQLCTFKPLAVPPDTPLSDVARLMIDTNIHHVIVTEGSEIRGVVSSLDFVRTFIE
jgi:CBS domain-containing protein